MALSNLKFSRFFPIIAGMVLTFAVGVTIVALQEQQEIRSRAILDNDTGGAGGSVTGKCGSTTASKGATCTTVKACGEQGGTRISNTIAICPDTSKPACCKPRALPPTPTRDCKCNSEWSTTDTGFSCISDSKYPKWTGNYTSERRTIERRCRITVTNHLAHGSYEGEDSVGTACVNTTTSVTCVSRDVAFAHNTNNFLCRCYKPGEQGKENARFYCKTGFQPWSDVNLTAGERLHDHSCAVPSAENSICLNTTTSVTCVLPSSGSGSGVTITTTDPSTQVGTSGSNEPGFPNGELNLKGVCTAVKGTCTQTPNKCPSGTKQQGWCTVPSGSTSGTDPCCVKTTTTPPTNTCSTNRVAGCPCSSTLKCKTGLGLVCTNGKCITQSSPGQTKLSFENGLFIHGIGKAGDSQNPGEQGGGTNPPVHLDREVTVDIYNFEGTQVVMQDLKVHLKFGSGTGDFKHDSSAFVNLSPSFVSGAYVVKVKMSQSLRKAIPMQITAGAVNKVPVTTLITGDSNGDNKVNFEDYKIIKGCVSEFEAAEDCPGDNKTKADITDDNSVTLPDLNLFLRELSNKQGD